LGCIDIEIRKSEFVAKTQFLSPIKKIIPTFFLGASRINATKVSNYCLFFQLKESQEYLIYPLKKTIYIFICYFLWGLQFIHLSLQNNLRPKKLHINIEQFKEIIRILSDY